MKNLLFSAQGRINRASFWKAAIIQIVGMFIVAGLCMVLAHIIPGQPSEDGGYSVSGAAAIPFIILIFGYLIVFAWSAICVGIKRFHDRGKAGIWVLIQFVPFIGSIWYFVEVGCLAGTAGPNQYGPDPLGGTTASTLGYTPV